MTVRGVLALLTLAGSLAIPTVTQAETTEIPLVVEHGILFVRGTLNGVGPMLFVFDPGAPASITTYARGRLNGQPVREIAFGAARIRQTMPVFPGAPNDLVPSHDPGLGVIAGSVGPDILSHYAVAIDYGKRTMALTPFAQATPPPGALALALRIDEFSMPVIAASADGHPGTFELDVRALSSMLFKPFAQRTGLSARYLGAPVLKTSDNGVQHAFAYFALGPYRVRNVPTWFSSATNGKFASESNAGLLGNNVLSHFVVTLDYQRRIAYISPAS